MDARQAFRSACFGIALIAGVGPGVAGEPPVRPVESLQATEIPVGGDFMGFGFDALWLPSNGQLWRISATDNHAVAIGLDPDGGPYRAVGIGETSVWVADWRKDLLYEVDPATNAVLIRQPVQMVNSVGSVAVGAGSVWVVSAEEGERTLSRFDEKSGKLQGQTRLPSDGSGLIFAEDAVWVAGNLGAEVYRIDPSSGQITLTVAVRNRPGLLAASPGAIWVVNEGDGTIQRIDTASGAVTATIETGRPGPGSDLSFGGGYVWAIMPGAPVIRIDPVAAAITHTFIGYGFSHSQIRYGAGSVWVSGPTLHRYVLP